MRSSKGAEQLISFLGAEGTLSCEQEEKLLDDICAQRPSALVLGWRRKCSPFLYGAKVLCRDDGGKEKELDGTFAADEKVERKLMGCGMLLSLNSSVRLWNVLTTERRKVRPVWRKILLEEEAGHFSTGLSWCDGTSTVMMFERLELLSLSIEVSQKPACSASLLSQYRRSSELLAARDASFSHTCVELVGLEGNSSFVSAHPDGKMHFEIAVSHFFDVFVDKEGRRVGASSEQQHLCALYRHTREGAEESLKFSCCQEVEIGWLEQGEHHLAAAVVSSRGRVLGGWNVVSISIESPAPEPLLRTTRREQEQGQGEERNRVYDIEGEHEGSRSCNFTEEIEDQHCYGMLPRQEETLEGCL